MRGIHHGLRKALPWVSFFLFPALFLTAGLLPGSAQVGGLPNLSPNQLQQLQQQLGQPSNMPAVPSDPSQTNGVVMQPELIQRRTASTPSRLEQIMSARAGVELQQFGYDQFGTGRSITVPQTGAVLDDYILGPGDEIVVSLRGTESNEARMLVDRNGQVVLPRINPISASGRTLGAFRQDLQAAVQRGYVATTAFVTVARVRQISVMVTGEVNVPGQRLVTGLASALDAILLSGGVKKTGSLRNVRLQRGGREHVIDLYSVLTDRGASSNLRLADGDRIRIPLLGPTVSVAGLVRQPGIFELAAGQRSISITNLMSLAGGEEVRGRYRISVLRVDADGRSRLQETPDRSVTVNDSEVLLVQPGASETVSRATLSGGLGLAGNYPITQGTKLSDILKAPGALGTAPYTLLGVVSRRDPRTLMRSLHAFTPVAVVNGGEDISLRSDDIIRVFSVEEARLLIATLHDYSKSQLSQQQALRNPITAIDATTPTTGEATDATGSTAVARTLLSTANNSVDSAMVQQNAIRSLSGRNANNRQVPPGMLAQGINDERREAGTLQSGAVADPTQNTQDFVNDLQQQRSLQEYSEQTVTADFQRRVAAPGGYALNRDAYTFEQVAQQLGIERLVLINFLIDQQVTVSGAVRGPGTYVIGPNVLLSDLVMAAGGTQKWADESGVERISTAVDGANGRAVTQRTNLPLRQNLLASYVVQPRDEFRFNQVFNDADIGTVTVQGEVRFTGSYKLTRGERLSDLLARAGGLTGAAYPYGTVFLRKSVAAVERDGYLRAAKEIEEQLVTGMTRVGPNRVEPAAFASMQGFVSELRAQQALGRISIVADPSVLASQPELDPLLEADDVIYIPQRPSTVTVLGQVMQPGSFPYRAGETVEQYIARAGGYGRFADNGQTFVVLPDGTARKFERSWFRFDAASTLPPGSAIIVPRDLMPFDLRQTLVDISQILSQFAVGIASVAVISRQ